MFLSLNNVSVGFGPPENRSEILRDVHLNVSENEFVSIIGFSGSGKSTLMALLAGLLLPDQGEIQFKGSTRNEPGPDRGIVFQNYSLLPWLTVFGNIELAVRQVFPRMSAAERDAYIQRHLDLVNLKGSERKRPHELSGGMRQRLSLARTLAMQPSVLLLDEPLSALDALTRSVLQDEIIRLWEEDKRTVIMITNDVDEAVLMSDRIIALTPGPRATLDQQFTVELPRPRDRATLNFSPAFKELRNEVTGYLIALNKRNTEARRQKQITPPALVPLDLAFA